MTTRSVYLAGPYAARLTLSQYAGELIHMGYAVTAKWLNGEHEAKRDQQPTREERGQWAHMDMRDVNRADVLVAFTAGATGVAPTFGTSGGRHIETGYALALNKRVILVGDEENVFHALPQIIVCPTWHEAALLLAHELVEHKRNLPRAADERAS